MTSRQNPDSETNTPQNPGPAVKIRYAERETGWAYQLPDGTYQIANVPLADGLNLGDKVRCEPGADGWPRVVEVLAAEFPQKTGFAYDRIEDFRTLATALREAGGRVEGCCAPRDGRPGLATVAHTDELDVAEVIDRLQLAPGVRVLGHEDDPEPEADDAQEP